MRPSLCLHPHSRTAHAGTCKVSEEQEPLLSSEGQSRYPKSSYPKSSYPRVISPEEEDLPACAPPGREVLTMSRTLLQLILAASACLQLDGKPSAGFSSPGILGGIMAPVCLLHRVRESQNSLSWKGPTKIIQSSSQHWTGPSPRVTAWSQAHSPNPF